MLVIAKSLDVQYGMTSSAQKMRPLTLGRCMTGADKVTGLLPYLQKRSGSKDERQIIEQKHMRAVAL
ncbi:hypothetical protein ROLI_019330 [Roseobacter fucihabitans]|uniref:Uncharacterized protein n=1 Tax=Roseobacter fucihabitans TaxID=1537242 RepID=A0ABZ2BUG1_9RHOB|nr:hypothetical protein [Roseobacter litoralis]